MNANVTALIDKIRSLEDELEIEFAKRRAELRFSIDNRKIVFEKEVLRRHRAAKVRLTRYVLLARPLAILTAPVIYSLIFPFVVLDLFVTVYQTVCFPIYGIPKVRRADYMVFDRSSLAYLNAVEKLNCAYCSYANGLIAYAREIAARTEQHWCPIKHARRILAPHDRYRRFIDFGDAEAYQKELEAVRLAFDDKAG